MEEIIATKRLRKILEYATIEEVNEVVSKMDKKCRIVFHSLHPLNDRFPLSFKEIKEKYGLSFKEIYRYDKEVMDKLCEEFGIGKKKTKQQEVDKKPITTASNNKTTNRASTNNNKKPVHKTPTTSDKQEKVFEYICSFVKQFERTPKPTEICDNLGFSSIKTVYFHLKGLEEKGYIRRSGSKYGSIQLLLDESGNKLQEPKNTSITSPKQAEVFEYICSFVKQFERTPKPTEICDNLGFQTIRTVYIHLKKLEEKGYIRRSGSRHGSIQLLVDEKGNKLQATTSENFRHPIFPDVEIDELKSKVAMLDELHRNVFLYLYPLDNSRPLKSGEIAQKLNIPRGSITYRKNKAIEKLSESLNVRDKENNDDSESNLTEIEQSNSELTKEDIVLKRLIGTLEDETEKIILLIKFGFAGHIDFSDNKLPKLIEISEEEINRITISALFKLRRKAEEIGMPEETLAKMIEEPKQK